MANKDNMRIKTHNAKSPQEIFDRSKIDYTKLAIYHCDNINFHDQFAVSPQEYLKYAKSDYNEGSQKGLINALSNAKRCIDCLVETVIYSLGIDPDNIPENALKFCDIVLPKETQSIRPYSLKLFCALGFSPSFLITEVRQLRNKVEHNYENPNGKDVLKAIEVAELLVYTVKAKEIYSNCIEITDTKDDAVSEEIVKSIHFGEGISYRTAKNVCVFTLSTVSNNYKNKYEYIFNGTEFVFFFFLKAMFVASFEEDILTLTIKEILKTVSIKTPYKNISIEYID